MKKHIFTVLVLLSLSACCDCIEKQSAGSPAGAADTTGKAGIFPPAAAGRLTSFFDDPEPASGHIVDFKSADSCIKKYQADMLLHGFGDTANPVSATWKSETLKITHGVAFRGFGMGSFVLEVLNRPLGANEEIEIHAQFGIYTKGFVSKYFSWPQDSAAKYNRVTVFLVPYKRIKSTAGPAKQQTPPDDEKVYNLGGLRP